MKEDYAKVAHQFVEMEIEAQRDPASQPIAEVEVDKEGDFTGSLKAVCVLADLTRAVRGGHCRARGNRRKQLILCAKARAISAREAR